MAKRKGLIVGFVLGGILLLAVLAGWMVWQQKTGTGARNYIEVTAEDLQGQTLAEGDDAEAGLSDAKAADIERESGTEDVAPVDEQGGQASEDDSQLTAEVESEMEQEITEPETTEPPVPEDITLLFAGDVYLSNHVLNAYNNAGGIHGVLDEGIRAEIDGADIFMVNQEFPFTDRGTAAADKQYTFRLPPEKVSMFHEMGIDIVTLANNHILDFGEVGLLDSCEILDAAGIKYVGGGPDFERASQLETITVGDKVIGFLGTSRVYMATSWAAGKGHPGVFSTYDPTLPLEAIKEAREQCDYLVVYVHWGVERETTPKEYQKVMGRQYIDAGADLVIGSHPHVLQPVEYYNGKPIVYSLGNFVFGSSIPKTMLFKVELSGEGGWEHGVTAVQETTTGGGAATGTDNGAGDGADTSAVSEPAVKVTMIPCTSSAGYTRLTGE